MFWDCCERRLTGANPNDVEVLGHDGFNFIGIDRSSTYFDGRYYCPDSIPIPQSGRGFGAVQIILFIGYEYQTMSGSS